MSDPYRRPQGSPPRERPPGSIKLGTIAGSDVLVTSSWFLIALLIAVIVAPSVDRVEPGLGGLKYLVSLIFAVILYGSVLLHEAAHAYVARHYGYPVGPITLHFLGGATEIDGEARRPRDEFWIAAVGPITSVFIGGIGVGLHVAGTEGLIGLAIDWVAGANLFVGALNLIPGLPLDGGRVLKSIVWGVTKNPHRGTYVAGWAGRVVAVLALLWPFFQRSLIGSEPQPLDYLVYVLIAMFLWGGATAAMTSARIRTRLPNLVARQLARRTLAVPGDLPLSEAVRRAQEAHAGSIVTTTSAGAPVGVVNEAALVATPEDRRPWMATSAVARHLDAGLALPADISGEDLIMAITRTPAAEYLLVESDGSICGVLATADVDAAFRRAGN